MKQRVIRAFTVIVAVGAMALLILQNSWAGGIAPPPSSPSDGSPSAKAEVCYIAVCFLFWCYDVCLPEDVPFALY